MHESVLKVDRSSISLHSARDLRYIPHLISRPEGKDYSVQRLILGTHTSDDVPNYLQIAHVQLPTEDVPLDDANYSQDKGFIYILCRIWWLWCCWLQNINCSKDST